MDTLIAFVPLLPLIASVIVGVGSFIGVFSGEDQETLTADISLWTITLSCLMLLTVVGAGFLGKNTGAVVVGDWLNSDTLVVSVSFVSQGIKVYLATLFTVLLAIIMRFSVNYMHREAGYHRFFFVLNLFTFAMLLLLLSGNAVMTFIGWEIAGLCSYLLIAYVYTRPVATLNATRVFITNRVGDAGFMLGIGLSFVWLGSVNWQDITTTAMPIVTGEATAIAFCFAVAAFAKSVQLPFTPWLSRAMEGPTPSSAAFYGAIMIHAGVFLVISLHVVFEQAPLIMGLLVVVGLFTAIYSFIVGLTQTDIKSALAFATSGQLGLMFMECGLGLWQIASWHLAAHAIVRGYHMLTAPSILYNTDNPVTKSAPSLLTVLPWLYTASLQRFWLDQLVDWGLVKPVQQLAHDLAYFDDHVLDRIAGVSSPVICAVTSLAHLKDNEQVDYHRGSFSKNGGLVGQLTRCIASTMHWMEERLVLRGMSQVTLTKARQLGRVANRIEHSVLRPRYLVLFVFITLLVIF